MENQDDPLDDDLLPWEGQKSDGDDFSSCGESEFERYCSANSALGTPSSVCSSSVYEFADSEFGPSSFDSFRLGGERKNLKNSVVDNKLLHISDACSSSSSSRIARIDGKRRIDGEELRKVDFYGSPDARMSDSEVVFAGNGVWGLGKNRGGAVGNGSSCEVEGVGENVNVDDLDELKCEDKVESCSRDLTGSYLQPGMEFDGNDADRCSDEYDALSRDGLSEFDDDSMSGGVLEDGRKIGANCSMNRDDLSGNHTLAENENGLFMSAGVAFGQDDWDDFMQETSESPLDMILKDELFSKRQECHDAEIGCHGSEVLNVLRISGQIQGTVGPEQPVNTLLSKMEFGEPGQQSTKQKQLSGVDEFTKSPETEVEHRNNEMDQNLAREERTSDAGSINAITEIDKGNGRATGISSNLFKEQVELEETDVMGDPLSNVSHSCSTEYIVDLKNKFFEGNDPSSMRLLSDKNPSGLVGNSPVLLNHFDDHFSPAKREISEVNVFYDEMVHEMDEILLDSGRSPGSRAINGISRLRHQPRIPFASRDGGSTASTSGTDEVYPLNQLPLRITGVEVIGARQKEGDVSFSERLVGVKKYTVYKLRVSNREENWEVERRYRDFYALYHRLKKLFKDQDLVIPLPWSSVERESRKLFGNASPDVVAERSFLIQECLQSIIHLEMSSSSLHALIHFLSPSKANISTPSTLLSESPHSSKGTETENVSALGSTISLIVHLRPYKSVKQLLEVQHYTCAGCRRNFDVGKTQMKELVQTLGWGKPRFCEYSGQLFCSSCHNNDTAVLPARVLQWWDFTHYTVSQLSKSYLNSIFDKPMLCVSAVNPHLFSRVPTLQHVRNVRKRIGDMLPFVRCSFRRAIQKGLGSRRYLLESNDFFALRDLIDLSKGMFAALPRNVETVSKTIREHITEQCLICCDSGIPCNAKQACNDPSALIFPFQEEEVEKCKSCKSVFHKNCFGRMVACSCGAQLKPIGVKGLASKIHSVARGDTDPSAGFLSALLSKVMTPRSAGEKETPKQSNSTVILMGSLPNTSL